MNTWYCQTCGKSFHHQGVAMHRRTHRDKKERVVFLTPTHAITYDYREEQS